MFTSNDPDERIINRLAIIDIVIKYIGGGITFLFVLFFVIVSTLVGFFLV
jgi:hypothetical protein